MTQILKDSIKIEYKLDQVTPISKYEMNAYNVPFAGNTSMCREVFVKGERKLEFSTQRLSMPALYDIPPRYPSDTPHHDPSDSPAPWAVPW